MGLKTKDGKLTIKHLEKLVNRLSQPAERTKTAIKEKLLMSIERFKREAKNEQTETKQKLLLKRLGRVKADLTILKDLSAETIVRYALSTDKNLMAIAANKRLPNIERMKARISSHKPLSTQLFKLRRNQHSSPGADNDGDDSEQEKEKDSKASMEKIDKMTINNQVVLMRTNTRRAIIHTINKWTKSIKKLRASKAVADKKARFEAKAGKLVKKIKYIKECETDDISKFALSSSLPVKKVLSDPKMPLKTQAMATVAINKFIKSKVEEFREKFPDSTKAVQAILKQKKNKKRKLNLLTEDANNVAISERKAVDTESENSESGNEDTNKVATLKRKSMDSESENSESENEDTNKVATLKRKSMDSESEHSESGNEDANTEEEEEEANGDEDGSEEDASEEEDAHKEDYTRVEEDANVDSDASVGGESLNNSYKEESLQEGESDSDKQMFQCESSDVESDRESLVEYKTNSLVVNKGPLSRAKSPMILPKKAKVQSDVSCSNNQSSKPQKPQPKVVDPFFVTTTNEAYVTSQVPAESPDNFNMSNWNNRKNDYIPTKSKSFSNLKPNNKWNNRETSTSWGKNNDFRRDSFKNPFDNNFEKTQTKERRPLGHLGNRKERRKALQQPIVEKKPEKLHPSWEAKKKTSLIASFQGKKITFD